MEAAFAPGAKAEQAMNRDRPDQSYVEGRLEDKDASDVVRLMQASAPSQVAETLSELTEHATAGPPTGLALERFHSLFGTRGGTGIEMAARALRIGMPEDRVRTICLAYASELRSALQ